MNNDDARNVFLDRLVFRLDFCITAKACVACKGTTIGRTRRFIGNDRRSTHVAAAAAAAFLAMLGSGVSVIVPVDIHYDALVVDMELLLVFLLLQLVACISKLEHYRKDAALRVFVTVGIHSWCFNVLRNLKFIFVSNTPEHNVWIRND
jgi:hypothetical protein